MLWLRQTTRATAAAAAAAAAEAVEEAAWLRCRCPGDAGVTVGETRPGGHPLRAPCPRPRHRPRHSRHRSLWWYQSRMPRLPLWPPSLQPDLTDSSRVSIPYLNIWRASPYFHRLRHSPLPPSPGAAPCTSTSPAAGLAAADCLPIATPAAALGRERRAPGQTTARARTPRRRGTALRGRRWKGGGFVRTGSKQELSRVQGRAWGGGVSEGIRGSKG